MTTDVKIPYITYDADGVKTVYTFAFPIVESLDLLVLVGGVLQVEYSTYTVENVTDNGGDVAFILPPTEQVSIVRKTTISQQLNYTADPFEAETHEFALDKITYILQELIDGGFQGVDSDGNPVILTLDLSVTAGVTTVTINNSAGSDAVIPQWESGELAGVFHGEITTSPPADGSATTHPDGFIIIEVAP